MQTFGARWMAGPADVARAWAEDCGAVDRRLVMVLLALPALAAVRFWPALLGVVPAVVAAALLSPPPRRPANAGGMAILSIPLLVAATGIEAHRWLWGDESFATMLVQLESLVLVAVGVHPKFAGAVGGRRMSVALRGALVVGLCAVAVGAVVVALRATSTIELCWAGGAAAVGLGAVWLAARHRHELQRLSRPETWRQLGHAVVVPTLGSKSEDYRAPVEKALEIDTTVDLLSVAVNDARWRSAFTPVAMLALGGAPLVVDLFSPRFPASIPSDAVISMGDLERAGFLVEIDASGHVTWEGRKGVPALGRRERDVDPAEVAALYRLMLAGDFSERTFGSGCTLGWSDGGTRLRMAWRPARTYRAPAHCWQSGRRPSPDGPTAERDADECDVAGRIHRIAGAWLGGLRSVSAGDSVTLRFHVDRESEVCVSDETVGGASCERRGDGQPRDSNSGVLVPFDTVDQLGPGFIVADPWSERALGARSALPEKGAEARCRFTAVRQLASVGIGYGPSFARSRRVWAGTLSDCAVRPR